MEKKKKKKTKPDLFLPLNSTSRSCGQGILMLWGKKRSAQIAVAAAFELPARTVQGKGRVPSLVYLYNFTSVFSWIDLFEQNALGALTQVPRWSQNLIQIFCPLRMHWRNFPHLLLFLLNAASNSALLLTPPTLVAVANWSYTALGMIWCILVS